MLRYRALGLRARMGRELCVTYNKIGNSKIHLIRTYKIVVEPESSESALKEGPPTAGFERERRGVFRSNSTLPDTRWCWSTGSNMRII
jgi:hypothetical protein